MKNESQNDREKMKEAVKLFEKVARKNLATYGELTLREDANFGIRKDHPNWRNKNRLV